MSKIPFYQSLAQIIHAQDLSVLFGLIGDANLFFVDHFKTQLNGTFVPAVHENGAVLMAMGYAQLTGNTGIATVTHGPGLTNCATALVESARARTPLLLIAGDTPNDMPEHIQSIDQAKFTAATGALFERVVSPETLARDFLKAYRRAVTEKTAVVLNVPAEFMWEKVEHQEPIYRPLAQPTLTANTEALEEAVGMLASAKRPMILAGKGAVDAKDVIISLADHLEAPLATTLKAKDLFLGHPYNMGIIGTLSSPACYDALAKSDCILCLGSSLNHFTTERGKLFEGKRVIHVDEDLRMIDRKYASTIGITADAGATAATILEWLIEAEIPPCGFTPELDPETLLEHPFVKPSTTEGTICFEEALKRLDERLPTERVLVTDGGRFMTEVWCRISTKGPSHFLSSVEFGSIGLGLAQAIGAASGNTNGRTVLFTGDGGFMMGGLNELNTAARLELNLTVIIANDGAYGAEHIQFLDRNMRPDLSEFNWPSFEKVANSLGFKAHTADSLETLEQALDELETHQGPALIELKLDPTQVPRMRI